MSQTPNLIRVSARIPADLYCRFENERHRRTITECRRYSANDLFAHALEAFLKEPSHADDDLF